MVDIILIIIFILAFYYGYQKGLVSSLIGAFGTILAFVISMLGYKKLALFLDAKFLLTQKIALMVANILPMPTDVAQKGANFDNLGSFYTWLESIHLPKSMSLNIVNAMQESIGNLASTIYANMLDTFSQVVAGYILNGLVFVLLWLGLSLFVKFGSGLFVGIIRHTPIVGKVDAIGGAIISTLLIVIVVGVIYNALEVGIEISSLSNKNDFLSFLAQSKIMPFIKNIVAVKSIF